MIFASSLSTAVLLMETQHREELACRVSCPGPPCAGFQAMFEGFFLSKSCYLHIVFRDLGPWEVWAQKKMVLLFL